MPRDASGGHGKSKPEMIREVLEEAPDLPAPQIRATVWDRFGGEVTTQEIAHMRKKLRQGQNGTPEPAAPPPAKARPERAERKRVADRPLVETAARKKPPAAIRARDFSAAEVTVKQLSAILEVAEQVGGLRRLHDALRTVLLLREKVGDVDERQLTYALDFLGRLTGKK